MTKKGEKEEREEDVKDLPLSLNLTKTSKILLKWVLCQLATMLVAATA